MYRLLIFFSFLLAACAVEKNTNPVKLLGEAQGTYYSIIYFDNQQRDLQFEIDSILRDFDQSVSLWQPTSIISRLNNNDTTVGLDKYFMDNLELSMDISAKTNGSFDITVGPLVRAWGFGFDESRHVDSLIVDSILHFVGYDKLKTEDGWFLKSDNRISIDFNAIAQGYSVDLICDFLEANNIDVYLVDIGGEVKGKGIKPDGTYWKVGIEKPAVNQSDARDLKAIIELKNKAVATSGNYRKFYEENGVRYSHTIDPKTGYPVRHSLLSVSVVANEAAVADAYATAFMVMGLEKAKEFLQENTDMEAFFIYSTPDGTYSTYGTNGFNELITKTYE